MPQAVHPEPALDRRTKSKGARLVIARGPAVWRSLRFVISIEKRNLSVLNLLKIASLYNNPKIGRERRPK
ncbi:MAG: hypothetical protein WBD99_13670 [Thermodesulfobacteriota bacterium]